jgi:hypothetical protein
VRPKQRKGMSQCPVHLAPSESREVSAANGRFLIRLCDLVGAPRGRTGLFFSPPCSLAVVGTSGSASGQRGQPAAGGQDGRCHVAMGTGAANRAN